MPLVYQQNINETSRLAVWHIDEPETFFLQKVMLSNSITHPHKRLQHLAGRYLLPALFEDFPLELIKIADTRKPFLPGETFHFSISHCGDYAAAIVSKTRRVGVDIEVVSEKIQKIRDKFLTGQEQEMIRQVFGKEDIPFLTLAWSIKESMFKWYGSGGIDFKQHLQIENITVNDNQFMAQCIFQKNEPMPLKVHGLLFNNNFLTWII